MQWSPENHCKLLIAGLACGDEQRPFHIIVLAGKSKGAEGCKCSRKQSYLQSFAPTLMNSWVSVPVKLTEQLSERLEGVFEWSTDAHCFEHRCV